MKKGRMSENPVFEWNQFYLAVFLFFILLCSLNTETGDDSRTSDSVLFERNQVVISDIVPHSPIIIVSNADFAAQASSEGWTGNGSIVDPYIIEAYNITSDGKCIGISGTNVHFIIRNCHLTSDGPRYLYGRGRMGEGLSTAQQNIGNFGISLYSVQNGTIFNNTIYDNSNVGIYIYDTQCSILNNTISNSDDGIHLKSSTSSIIANNTLENCSVRISGISIENWQQSFENNLVNGKELGYYIGHQDIVLLGNMFGQIILVDCRNITVQNGEFGNTTIGISIGFSTECKIRYNTFTNCSIYGMEVAYSNNSVIANNSFSDNYYGFFILTSQNCQVENNTLVNNGLGMNTNYIPTIFGYPDWYHNISQNTVNGKPLGYFMDVADLDIIASDYGQLIIANCSRLDVHDGELSAASMGVLIGYSNDCNFTNIDLDNNIHAIWMKASDRCIIQNSTVSNSEQSSIFATFTNEFQIINNTFFGNAKCINFVTGVRDCTIIENKLENNPFGAISLIAEDLLLANNTFSGNMFDPQLTGTTVGAINIVDPIRVQIINNSVFNNNGVGINLAWGHSVNLTNNRVYNNGHRGIVVGADNSKVYNNTCYGNGNSGLFVNAADNCWVEKNDAYDNSMYGIHCVGVNNTYVNNRITNNTSFGFNIRFSINCTFIENEILNGSSGGVYFQSSHRIKFLFNSISNNVGDGILLAISDHINITNCEIYHNSNGVSLSLTNSCKINYNMIYNNSLYGIEIPVGNQDNHLYGNIIAWNSGGTAVDDGTLNSWNSTSIGNQWSDYGGSGIYTVPGTAGSIDYYPLTIGPFIEPITDFERNSPKIRLTWKAIGLDPSNYAIFVNGVPWEQGIWDGWSVSSTVSFPFYGLYNITLFLNDTNGISTSSTVHFNFISGYVVHDPITITSDAGFAAMAIVESWAGDGTPGNPHIIEGYNITHDEACISVSNVNLHFIIRNCHLTSTGHSVQQCIVDLLPGAGSVRGAHLASGRTGVLLNDGINLNNVQNVTIFNNTLVDNMNDAIFASNSLCTIINNTITNSDEGIRLVRCSGSTLANNTFENCGIRFSGTSLRYWEHIVENNLVNGKEIGYYYGMSDLVIDGINFGGIILVSCRNVTITNGVFSNSSIGVLIGYSTECEIRENTFGSNSIVGLEFAYSNNTIIANNSFSDNYYAAFISYSIGFTIENNTLTNNGLSIESNSDVEWNHLFSENTVNGKELGYYWDAQGLTLDADDFGQLILANCRDIVVQNGAISQTSEGIAIGHSQNCSVSNVIVHDCVQGIWVGQSDGVSIRNSTFYGNSELFAIDITGASLCQIYNNTIYSNAVGIRGRGLTLPMFVGNTIRNNSYSAIRIIGAAPYNIVANNTVYGNGYTVVGQESNLDTAIYLEGNTYTTVKNNSVFENHGSGIDAAWCYHYTITQNTVYRNGWYQVRMYGGEYGLVTNNLIYEASLRGLTATHDHLWVEGNTIYNQSLGIFSMGLNISFINNEVYYCGTGISIQGLTNSTLIENEVYGNSLRGIYIDNSPGIKVVNNTIHDNMYALDLSRSNNSEISNNWIHDNAVGLTINSLSFVSVFSNEIWGSYSDAGVLIQICNEVTLNQNRIFDNNRGVSLSQSNSCVLTYNMVYENALDGIQLTLSSQENLIFGNIIAWNTAGNGLDDGTLNSWNSVTGIGNQWSDYLGTGVYEIPGSANSTDNYPSVVTPTILPIGHYTTDELLPTYSITWEAMGVHSDTYVVYWSGTIYETGDWDGWSISVTFSIEEYGVHNLTLYVNDTDGNHVVSTHIVTINTTTTTTTPPDITTTTTPPPDDFMPIVMGVGIGSIAIVVVAFVLTRRRRVPSVKPEIPPEPTPVVPILPEEPEEPEEVFEGVQALRGCAPVGGKFEYKVKIKNDTRYVIHNVTVTIVRYPEDCMEISGETTKKIAMIDPGGFISPQFTFIPTKDCVEGRIVSSVSYLNHEGELEMIEVEPYVILSVCDLLEPLESTMEEFELILSDMSVTKEEREMEWNPEVLYRKAEKLLPNRNFYLLEAESSSQEGLFRGVIRGLAEGKYTRKKVAVRIVITGRTDSETSHVIVEGLGEDAAMLPTTVLEITDGMSSWICMHCGSGLKPDEVTKIKRGEPHECQYCGHTMTIDLYRG